MRKKIFVSYKYADASVALLLAKAQFFQRTTARAYVDQLEILISENDIYKGECDGTDLSQFTDDTIWTSLKRKIFDSSITIVLISKAMKDWSKPEDEQWMPKEISYSLKEITHDNNKKSLPNALIYIVLPDNSGSYNYYLQNAPFYGAISYNTQTTFEIMNRNLLNGKGTWRNCSYAVVVKWCDFIKNRAYYIEQAVERQRNIDSFNICKEVPRSDFDSFINNLRNSY